MAFLSSGVACTTIRSTARDMGRSDTTFWTCTLYVHDRAVSKQQRTDLPEETASCCLEGSSSIQLSYGVGWWSAALQDPAATIQRHSRPRWRWMQSVGDKT